jgi:arginine N-succinyltransferase
MIVFRSLQAQDLDAIYSLTHSSELGITSLPHEKKIIKQRLKLAIESFQNPSTENECYYWFMLEDTASHTPLGVSAIATQVGIKRPFYVYKRMPVENSCPSLHIVHQDERLALSDDLNGADELCTLYLRPNARASGLGRFLSRARFLFMGQFRTCFSNRIIAELRGVSNEHGRSPFWEAVNKHFFHMSFSKADKLTLNTDKQFIADLLPTDPIYVSMLPKSAQAVIGHPHVKTVPAMEILLHEGFQVINYIDIFDGGPIMAGEVSQIKTVRAMRQLPVRVASRAFEGSHAMVANTAFGGFRAVQTEIQLEAEHVLLGREAAEALKIEENSFVYFVPSEEK